MAEAKKTSPTRKKTTAAKAPAAKATARKPASAGPGGADAGLPVPGAPLTAGTPGTGNQNSPVDLGAELSLPFEQIIGGPLQGVIRSSALAANETAQFINNIGFAKDPADAKKTAEARTVKFAYNAVEREEATGTAGAQGKPVKTEVEVPLLAVVPIPYLQLSKVTLDFDVKIDSVSARKQETQFGGETSATAGFWGVSASVKASYSSNSSSSDTVNRSASMKVHVEAVQGDMPGGMAKILEMLTNNAVTTQRTKA
ncbi:DUF2589 domain-containing protein [Streptomyces sp. NPDC057340]|uniref:DUF2589 domain-containing protein n=1 Tax=Streptomyces sp. NPDC057340 TaxID=3346103 RepID=UPI0036277959